MAHKAPKWAKQAVSNCEAACLMGVGKSEPARKLYRPDDPRGRVIGREIAQVTPSGAVRTQYIFDGESCWMNGHRYFTELMEQGNPPNRKRQRMDLVEECLEQLAAIDCPIPFADAIGVAEARKILSVSDSQVRELVALGEIVGRKCLSLEPHKGWWRIVPSEDSRQYIISRSSCAENAAMYQFRPLRGRPRKLA